MALILQAQAERSSRPSPGTDKGDNAPPHRFILHRATKKGLCLTEHPPAHNSRVPIGWNHRCVRRCVRHVAVPLYVISCWGWRFWRQGGRHQSRSAGASVSVPGPKQLSPPPPPLIKHRRPFRQRELEMLRIADSELRYLPTFISIMLCNCVRSSLCSCLLIQQTLLFNRAESISEVDTGANFVSLFS